MKLISGLDLTLQDVFIRRGFIIQPVFSTLNFNNKINLVYDTAQL